MPEEMRGIMTVPGFDSESIYLVFAARHVCGKNRFIMADLGPIPPHFTFGAITR
jgi:hypothetical protein